MKKVIKYGLIIGILIVVIFLTFLSYKIISNNFVIKEKREIVEKDELEYGDNYQEFKCEIYKQKPDRIIVKKAETNNQFFVFDKEHEEYERLLKVAEDRMSNSMMQDFNLWGFTPYTLKDVSESKENFVIFDYDEEIEDRDYLVDISFNRDVFFRFPNSTRLYRLIDYLSYCYEPVDSGSLKYIMDKSDFIPEDQIVSGYKYMNPSYFMD